MIYFTFNGKLRINQKTEKFNPYSTDEFNSGWTRRQLLFSGVNGNNRQNFTLSGGYFLNNDKYTIKTFSPSGQDEAGNRIKSEMIEIPWKERLLQSSIDKVADFRKISIDLNEYGYLRNLEKFAEKIHEGVPLTDEELASVGLKDDSEVAEALENAKKRKKEFISEWDAAEFMYKVITSGKYDNKNFHIRGVVEKQWSDMKQQWYSTMKPQRIYIAPKNEAEMCEGTATLYFTDGAVDDASLEEKGKYYVKAYTMEYDSTRKSNIPCEFQLVILKAVPHAEGIEDGKDEARAKAAVKKFTVDDGKVYEYGVVFDFLNGSQKVEITEDKLDPQQKEDLELGLITMDEIRAELGGSIYGDRVVENCYKGVMRGYTKGRNSTVYTDDDLQIPPLDADDDLPFKAGDDSSDDELDDLFGE